MPRRPQSEPRVATAVRLPKALHDELHHQAELRDVSVNFLVIRAVTQYLASAPDPLGAEVSGAGS
jgi:predicted HicB family RNase H-like nuclease